jgi:hypothetical protein
MATSDLVVQLRLDTEPMEQALRALAKNFLECADALAEARPDRDAEDK